MESGADKLTDDKVIKIPFNKNNLATTENKWNCEKDPITRVCWIGTMTPMWCSYSKMVDLSLLAGSLSVLGKTFRSHELQY